MKYSKVEDFRRFRSFLTMAEILENDRSIIEEEVGTSIKRRTKADKIGNVDD